MESVPKTFFEKISLSFKSIFTQPVSFFPIIIIFSLIIGLMEFGLTEYGFFEDNFINESLWLATALGISYTIISALLGLFFSVTIIKASQRSLKEHDIACCNHMRWTYDHLIKTIITALTSFWYIFKVAFLPLAVIIILYLGINSYVVVNMEVPGVEIDALQAINSGKTPSWYVPVNLILTVLADAAVINAVIFGILRGTKAVFTLYAMADKKIYGKKALQKSINMVKGNFGKVFWNYLFASILFALAIMIPFTIIAKLLENFFTTPTGMHVVDFLNTFLLSIIATLTIFFINSLYTQIKAKKTE